MYPEHPSMLILSDAIYSFHMPLFMSISGYLFYTAYFDTQGQPKLNRIYRQSLNLGTIYFIFVIFFVALRIIFSPFVNSRVSLADVLWSPICPYTIYWYLYVLVQFYIVFSRRIVYSHHALVSCLTAVGCMLSIFISSNYFALNKFISFAFFFWLGICYRRGTAAWFGRKAVAPIFFTVSVTVYVLTYNTTVAEHVPGVKMVIALGILQGLWYAFEHFPFLKSNRFLSMFGRYSLEIYLLHVVFTAGARTVFPGCILDHYILSVTLNLILSSTMPVLFAYCCKKLSVHDLFFKPVAWLEKRKQA